MRPVFLFYMGVVIFAVWPASGELDRVNFIAKVFNEVVIYEVAAIITVKTAQREGKPGFNVFYLFQDTGFPFAPDSSLFSPAGSDVNQIDGVNEHTGDGIAAMGNGISLKESRAVFVPLISFNRDTFTQ
jgi:hypothetical protein